METVPFAAMLQGGSEALGKALSDPGVERIAQSLHLDLRDPATLNGVLAMTQQYAESAPEVGFEQKQLLSRELAPGHSGRAREAIRTYLEIAAMT